MTTTLVSKKERIFGAMMMVAGCSIGAGMIGLPVLSMAAGFIPSCLAIFFVCAFSTGTGLLLLEATLWFKQEVNYLTIAQFALGKLGKYLIGSLFLFLFYGIFVSYLDGGGQIFNDFVSLFYQGSLPREFGILVCAICVGAVLATGVNGVDRVNRMLLIGLIFSYSVIIFIGSSYINHSYLLHIKWSHAFSVIPVLFISFGYQNLVPSLVYYLNKNVRAIRVSIVFGNLITMSIYLLWNYVILGIIPRESLDVLKSGLLSELLQESSSSCFIIPFINLFIFFALFTSFITIGLSFMDFIRDGFGSSLKKRILISVVLIPPLAICLIIPNLFLSALSFVGGGVNTILYGIFPVMILWVGRYYKNMNSVYCVSGGKSFLMLMGVLSLAFGLLFYSTFS